jgi:BON domain
MARTRNSNLSGARWPRAGAAFFLLAAFSAGCASPAYRRAQDQDRPLSVRINTALAEALPGRAVEGRTYQGVVALFGKVPTEDVRRRAEMAALAVRGVARVNNLILVGVGEEGDSPKAVGSAPVQGIPVIAARAETAPAP